LFQKENSVKNQEKEKIICFGVEREEETNHFVKLIAEQGEGITKK